MSDISRVELSATTVIKRFFSAEAFQRELEVYMRGMSFTPRLLDYREPDWIQLERVKGLPYLDTEITTQNIILIAQAIMEFHSSTYSEGKCLCHWDNQPGNILLSDASCYLIDFADAQMCFPEDDLSHLFLFWAGEFNPILLKELCDSFLNIYEQRITVNRSIWNDALQRSIERFDQRRLQHHKALSRLDATTFNTNREILRTLFLDS